MDGHWLGGAEHTAYRAGVPLETIFQARNYYTAQETVGMDVYHVLYDGFGNELDRVNVGMQNALIIAGAIAGYQVFFVPKIIPVPRNLPKNIQRGQQGKHIPGHPNFTPARSAIADGVNPQELLDGVHSGMYPIVRINPRNQPVVNFGRTIGYHQGKATQYGTVHYGKNGAHIVPSNPIQF